MGQLFGGELPAVRTVWSTSDLPVPDRFPSWEAEVSKSHLPWKMDRSLADGFEAQISVRAYEPYRLIACSCAPVQGHRAGEEITRTAGEHYCLLNILQGRELLQAGDREIVLGAGDFVLWHSDRKMRFTVPEPLRKLTLVIPAARMEDVLPFAQDYVGRPIDGRTGLGAIWSAHMRALNTEAWAMSADCSGGIMQATMELLAQVYLAAGAPERRSSRAVAVDRARAYIRGRLGDEALSPTSIAADLNMSLRYLHLAFEGSGATVAETILRQRLARSYRLLSASDVGGRSITDIALSCGFRDPAHFSRAFRRQYGLSPRDLRATRQ